MLELFLRRHRYTQESTIGTLFVDGLFYCYTLEDPVRLVMHDGIVIGHKIRGQTAIPAGEYDIEATMSNRFQKVLVELLHVPQFEGVRIHGGNTADNTEGCILVAQNAGPDWIGGSAIATSAAIAEGIARGASIHIEDLAVVRNRILKEGHV